jgi:hypothetical protein
MSQTRVGLFLVFVAQTEHVWEGHDGKGMTASGCNDSLSESRHARCSSADERFVPIKSCTPCDAGESDCRVEPRSVVSTE